MVNKGEPSLPSSTGECKGREERTHAIPVSEGNEREALSRAKKKGRGSKKKINSSDQKNAPV